MASETPLFRFGVIADIQYCDCDDASNFAKTAFRYYRNSVNHVTEAVKSWNQTDIAFIAQLGDIIDVKNNDGRSQEALKTVLDEFDKAHCQDICHLIGNHECYNFSQEELATGPLHASRQGRSFYDFVPHEGWRVVVLDAYDESMIGRAKDDPSFVAARELLLANNPNDVDGTTDWLLGLTGVARRFAPYNGALSQAQLDWLRATLEKAQAGGEKVIMLSHISTFPGSCVDSTLMFNYDAVLDIIDRFSPSVVAFLSGHDHAGGVKLDPKSGCLHLTLASPLECKPDTAGETAFGVVGVFRDKFVVDGQGGKVPTITIEFGASWEDNVARNQCLREEFLRDENGVIIPKQEQPKSETTAGATP